MSSPGEIGGEEGTGGLKASICCSSLGWEKKEGERELGVRQEGGGEPRANKTKAEPAARVHLGDLSLPFLPWRRDGMEPEG